jgi:uncharacterized protein YqjF (DUF2071 family)
MSLWHSGPTIGYECRRRWPGPRGTRSSAVVDIGERFERSELSELDHFLTARWALYSAPLNGLHRARAHHEPWPLHRASLRHLHDELVAAAGLPEPHGTPLVHFSPSVEVRIGWPHGVAV